MTPPKGIDPGQYRTQAKELLKLAHAADLPSLDRIRNNHPERDLVVLGGRITLADVQLVIAREHGFASWARFKNYLLFRRAVNLVDAGETELLDEFLATNRILSYHCYDGDWYEEGYFRGAALLNHVAGNRIRCPLPSNVIDVAKTLLNQGADPNVATDAGWTTIGLILTGKQVADAGVGVALIDVLKGAGARDDLERGDILTDPLWNGGRATAEELVRRGTQMDLRHAAALGRLDDLRRMLKVEVSRSLMEEALIYASHQGEETSARILIEHGATGDILIQSTGRMPGYAARATALHMAAWSGRAGIVRLLLDNGADATVIEPTYHGTALGWAEYGEHPEIAAMLREEMEKRGDSLQTFVKHPNL
jgi:hypothetical protein